MESAGRVVGFGLLGVDRILGQIRGPREGPTLIALGGMHGNETAGILALRRVLARLFNRRALMFGDIVALAGNRGALAQKRRFLTEDLNRLWTPSRMASLEALYLDHSAKSRLSHAEDREQTELLQVLEEIIRGARGDVHFLDLHTTSGPGEPFTTIADSSLSLGFARDLPVPLILGLAEILEGTLTGFLSTRGIPGVVFEGGQHGAPRSIAASEAAIWVSLRRLGIIRDSGFPEAKRARGLLRTATRGLPTVLEMRYRHPVSSENGFRMLPGFRSFQPIEAGQTLATDAHGEVTSPEAGLLLLPLYQPQGEDGFFLVRPPPS